MLLNFLINVTFIYFVHTNSFKLCSHTSLQSCVCCTDNAGRVSKADIPVIWSTMSCSLAFKSNRSTFKYECRQAMLHAQHLIYKCFCCLRIPSTSKSIGGPGSSVGIATGYGLDGPGIESRCGARFSAPVQTGPGAHPASCTMGTRSFPGVKSGRGVTLTPHPLLLPWS